jgi:hypothetical protein
MAEKWSPSHSVVRLDGQMLSTVPETKTVFSLLFSCELKACHLFEYYIAENHRHGTYGMMNLELLFLVWRKSDGLENKNKGR